ncbi:MAD2L1-binding protein isoform X2 [Dunckerocampus dactyliophorus]|uniref:MAD2L1-binding protein isoform X2 n=1 Tax=Dunckerocampus dactyliophorus TaxID=161453 RepID=UPI0024068843|nr:MAD2L1-binding protein isoform X2 [Dunckerocampus dactyliophorus]
MQMRIFLCRLNHMRSQDDGSETSSRQHCKTSEGDAEMARRAEEEGCVNVVFPGSVTQEGCCRFVSEVLKCVLYQRQQLPMTFDQLVYSQRKQQDSISDKAVARQRQTYFADLKWRKCQKTLQDLEELLQQLEVLFSLSKVPRVLLLIGGSVVLPKEIYEINMEQLVLDSGDQCLRVSSCLRHLFRTLFVADFLSDTRPVHLTTTAVLALAHRDCGVGWFHPKLHFKLPTCVKNKIIALSSDPCSCKNTKTDTDCQEYVWFQAPTAIKGFCL